MKVLVSWMRELGGYVSREFHFIAQAYRSVRSILLVGGMEVLLWNEWREKRVSEPLVPELAEAAAK
jgi:hypothetical protein